MTTATSHDPAHEDHLAAAVRAACLLEVAAPKPGNVHPQASFPDLTHEHFRRAAIAVAPILAQANRTGVGRAIRDSVLATAAVAPSNVNLGIILLLAPLAAVPAARSLADGIADVLDALTIDDARLAYEAIRLARPGGMGRVGEQDVADTPTVTFREVMALAADRDRIAFQYANRFTDILDFGLSWLAVRTDFGVTWQDDIVQLALELLARFPDSLIVRKCGIETAREASARAAVVLKAGEADAPGRAAALEDFDRWLRADGNRRNPGTTADLVAACLFAAFREWRLAIPSTSGFRA